MSKDALAESGINRQRLFLASCIALVTTAMAFSIRADILNDLGVTFNISHDRQGLINLMGIWGFPIAIVLVGPLCDWLGMGRLLWLACIGHIVGIVVSIAAPAFGATLGFPVLLLATLCIGLANGTVEGVINPLVATMYPDKKTEKLNALHAWWPGGLIVGGVLAYILTEVFGLGWKVKMAMILIAAVTYGYLLLGQKFPPTERVAAGISTAEMFRAALSPGFLFLLGCMCLTAITELGPDQWVGSVLTDTVGIRGILFLVYTSGLMFLLRTFAGPVVHAFQPVRLVWLASIIAAAGLFFLSYAFTPVSAFAAATVFGLGKAYFWPTMLGIASERYPRTGSLGLALMGAVGMFAAGLAGPGMGRIYDNYTVAHLEQQAPQVAQKVIIDGRYSPQEAEKLKGTADETAVKEALRQGAAMSIRWVSILPTILIFVFGGMLLYYRSIGGYRAIKLDAQPGSPAAPMDAGPKTDA